MSNPSNPGPHALPSPAELYLATILEAITRRPDEGDIPAYTSAAAAFLAERPQPYDAYAHPLMPYERVMAYGITREGPRQFTLCALARRWGLWRTDHAIATYPTLRAAHTALEVRSGVIVELLRAEVGGREDCNHWLAVPRADNYREMPDSEATR